jgi:hypothetical protein
MIAVLAYLAVGVIVVLIGFITMMRSNRRRELLSPRVFLRTSFIGLLAFLFWPVMVLLAIVWQFPAGRAWMIDFFGGVR